MAIISRLAGAILAHDGDNYWQVGDLKEPLSYPEFGFMAPSMPLTKERPFFTLATADDVGAQERHAALLTANPGLPLLFALGGAAGAEALPVKLAEVFLIRRNNAVSDRLWRLVIESSPRTEVNGQMVIDGRWLGQVPAAVWEAVRDSVLRC